MEALAPALELILEVRFGIEKGESLKRTLTNFARHESINPWRTTVALWLQLQESGRSTESILSICSFSERRVLELLEQGLKGESVFAQVCGLEEELFEASKMEMEEFVSTLSVKALVPLLFFSSQPFLSYFLARF